MAKLAVYTLEAAVASSAVVARPELRATVSSGQIACLLTYAGFFALWTYAELVDFTRCEQGCIHCLSTTLLCS